MVTGIDIIKEAMSYEGKVDYVFGKVDWDEEFDCSGFVVYIYKILAKNIFLPHFTPDLIKMGKI